MMNLMEPLFDIAYLGVVIALGLRLIFENNRDAKSYGLMAVILGAGDAFHLIPRVISNLTPGGFEKYVSLLSWGEFVTSITMTLFYVLFYHYYRTISKDNDKTKGMLIYVLAALRVIMVLLPQNEWGTKGNYLFGLLRNVPFALMGLLLIVWTWKYRNRDGLKNTSILIAASFLFYLPVVIGARFIPVLGAFMIPKTIAYVLLVVVGFRYFIKDFKAENILKTSAAYLILGLVGGVFYREFTKYFRWTGFTSLSVVHVHMIALGFLFLLIVFAIMQNEKARVSELKRSLTIYNTGLAWTVVTFMVRGIYTITAGNTPLFKDAMLSGIAGLGHIILATGIVMMTLKMIKVKSTDGK